MSKRRRNHAWQQKDVSDELLNQVFDLAKWAPTSLNSLPARFLFVKSKAAKAKLIPALSETNVPQVVAAPVTVVVPYDKKFYDELPTLFPAFDARPLFVTNPALSQATAFRNGSLQGAYLMLAARALGLDVGPMSGFDNAKVDEAFFQGKSWKSNFLCNIGYGDAENYSLAARASALNKLARSFEGFFLPAPVPQRQSTECPVTNDYVAPFGRLLIAGVFLLSGLGKLAAPAMTQAYIASTGLPLPIAGFLVAIVMEIWGGPASAGRLPYDLRGDRNGRIHE